MSYYSYEASKDVLNDTDRARLICVLLSSMDTVQLDIDRAATAYGAASNNSMRVMFNTALKKIADNGGKIDAATGEASAVVEKASKPTTPRKNKAAGDAEDDDEVKEKKSTPRKRKAAADGEEGEEKKSTPRKRKTAADGENGEEKKTPKKRMTKKQKEELAKKEQLDAEAAAAIAPTGADEGDEGLADAEVSENDKKILTEEAAHDDA